MIVAPRSSSVAPFFPRAGGAARARRGGTAARRRPRRRAAGDRQRSRQRHVELYDDVVLGRLHDGHVAVGLLADGNGAHEHGGIRFRGHLQHSGPELRQLQRRLARRLHGHERCRQHEHLHGHPVVEHVFSAVSVLRHRRRRHERPRRRLGDLPRQPQPSQRGILRRDRYEPGRRTSLQWATVQRHLRDVGEQRARDDDGRHGPALSNTPTDAEYSIAMSIDTYGYGSVSVNGGARISVGYVGLGSFDVLLGQRELNTLTAGGEDGGWFSAGLTPNYCSNYNFSDDFANDTSLNTSCWQAATPATVGNYAALNDLNANYVHATYETPSLAFSSGMQMAGLTGTPQWNRNPVRSDLLPAVPAHDLGDGQQPYRRRFLDLRDRRQRRHRQDVRRRRRLLERDEQRVPGQQRRGSVGGRQRSGRMVRGQHADPLSLSEGTTYDITMAVNANGTDSVSVNGGPPVELNGGQSLGSGPFYVVLAQRESTNQYDVPFGEGTDLEATWGSVSLQPSVATSLAVSPGSVDSVESVPESAVAATSVGSSGSTTGGHRLGPARLDPARLHLSRLGPARLDPARLDPARLDPPSTPSRHREPALHRRSLPPGTALSSTLLSDISIKYSSTCGGAACAGWAAILYGTPYANVPLESVTLADVL